MGPENQPKFVIYRVRFLRASSPYDEYGSSVLEIFLVYDELRWSSTLYV